MRGPRSEYKRWRGDRRDGRKIHLVRPSQLVLGVEGAEVELVEKCQFVIGARYAISAHRCCAVLDVIDRVFDVEILQALATVRRDGSSDRRLENPLGLIRTNGADIFGNWCFSCG